MCARSHPLVPREPGVCPGGSCCCHSRFPAASKRRGGAASGDLCLCCGDLVPVQPRIFFLLIPAHLPVYIFPPFPIFLALLFHGWLDVTHHSALRDMTVFLD